MFSKIETHIRTLSDTIPSEERQEKLKQLTEYIQGKIVQKEMVNLNFVCTHNSRRSHLAQIWAQTLATYYGIPNVHCYSGGTEATAVFPQVITTLQHQGFDIQELSSAQNAVHCIKFDENTPAIIGFSKVYDNAFNPQSGFGAVMVCSSADQECPQVFGADFRLALPFEDPKQSDGSPDMEQTYFDRSLEIASELNWVFSNAKTLAYSPS